MVLLQLTHMFPWISQLFSATREGDVGEAVWV